MVVKHQDRFTADDARLAELILHISTRCADWEHFDAALLERILFQADFLHFKEHGAPITGQAYRRGLTGPTPRGLGRVLRGLAREFAMLESPLGDGLHVVRRPLALRAARLDGFDAKAVVTLERVLDHYRRAWNPAHRGPDLLEVPWDDAEHREILPYTLALEAPAPASERTKADSAPDGALQATGIGPGAPGY